MIQFELASQLSKIGLFATSSLKHTISPNIVSRRVAMSRLDGYPRAAFGIGRIQSAFSYQGSVEDLLYSVSVIKNCALVAAHALLAAEGAKMDKAPIADTDIATYVQETIRSTRLPLVDLQHLDLVMAMVTSWEADGQSWTLINPDKTDDSMHCQFSRLYNTLSLTSDLKDSHLPIVDVEDKIMHLSSSPIYQGLIPAMGNKKEKDSLLEHVAVLTRLSLIIQLDHLHSLLNSRDIWFTFMPPRYEAKNVQSNIDRAKGLETFAAYLQNILLIPHIVVFESAMYGTELLQTFLKQQVSLPEHISKLVETTRAYDSLSIRHQFTGYFDTFTKAVSLEQGDAMLNLPVELITILFNEFEAMPQRTSPSVVSVTDLSKFSPFNGGSVFSVLAGQPLQSWSFKRRLIEFLNLPSLLHKYIKETTFALYQLTDVLRDPRVLGNIKALECKSPYELNGQYIATTRFKNVCTREATDQAIHYDPLMGSLSPVFTEFVRYKKSFQLTSGQAFANSYHELLTAGSLEEQGLPQHIVPSFDRPVDLVMSVDKLRLQRWQKLTGMKGRTLVPSAFCTGQSWTAAQLAGDSQTRKAVLQDLVGTHWETMAIQMSSLPFLEDLATRLSSVGCLVVDQTNVTLQSVTSGNATMAANAAQRLTAGINGGQYVLVVGEGHPYGISYNTLFSLQGTDSQEARKVPIAHGVYLLVHERIPVPSTLLARGFQTYLAGSFPYFPGGTSTVAVERWGSGEVGFNFALFSTEKINQTDPIDTLYSTQYVYGNDVYYLNLFPLFQPLPTQARGVLDVAVKEQSWPYRLVYNAEYVVKGAYGKNQNPHADDLTSTDQINFDKERLAVQAEKDRAALAAAEKIINQQNLNEAGETLGKDVDEALKDRDKRTKEGAGKEALGDVMGAHL